jgi:putative NIF3 family GTP cyclohydrolase 1 type 2
LPRAKVTIDSRQRRLRVKAGVKHCIAYAYRHSFATDALAKGVPDAQVAALLVQHPFACSPFAWRSGIKEGVLLPVASKAAKIPTITTRASTEGSLEAWSFGGKNQYR